MVACHAVLSHQYSDIFPRYCNIGLSFLNQHHIVIYTIQLNIPDANEKKYINLYNLKTALSKDMDLSNLPQDKLCLILQTLFICTGCDYISYFKSIGKVTILNFFQHTSFICGINMPGFLHNTANVISACKTVHLVVGFLITYTQLYYVHAYKNIHI